MKQFLLFCIVQFGLQAQKSQDFLKVLPDPASIESASDWAKLMYSEDCSN